jgi:lipopolysaccharide/colanic/teichoic acid biosynthesis glycosyltransferase
VKNYNPRGDVRASFETIAMKESDPGRLQLAAKRLFDIVASGIILVLLSPLLLSACLVIKLGTRGPIFSVTAEHLRDNHKIRVFCFRCTHRRPLTFIGRFLVSSGIDRLPILTNVLRGEMSIIGPRGRIARASLLDCDQQSLKLRADLFKPGLINPGEVIRGPIDTDVFYVSNWSLGLDASIFLLKLLSKETYLRH